MKYINSLIKKFKMKGCKTVDTLVDNNKALKKEDDILKAYDS